MYIDEGLAIRLMLLAAAAAHLLISIEYIYWDRRNALGPGTLFTWDVCAARQSWTVGGWQAKVLSRCFQSLPFTGIMWLRVACCAALAASDDRVLLCACLLLLAVTTVLMTVRHVHGHDGADQMLVILSTGLAAYFLFDAASPWRWAGILFIGLQAVLSYAVSGSAKMTSEVWRSGKALPGVFMTRIYGTPPIGAFLKRHPSLSRMLAWGLMSWQVSTPVMVLLSGPFVLGWMAMGLLFHASAALFMGLNTFLIVFVGTYPAVLLLAGFAGELW